MKKILLILMISINFSFASDVQEISVQELKTKIATKDSNIVVLDVRTPLEHLTGIIQGAKKKNAYSLDFKKYVKALDKSKTYLIYCHSGARSHNATQLFKENGIKAYNVKGGISAWKDKGFKTVK